MDTDRVAAGLAAYSWTDPAIVAGTGVKVRAVHVSELALAIQDLWTPAGLGTLPAFSGGAIAAGTRLILQHDLLDPRGWLCRYEQSGDGQMPTVGTSPRLPREVNRGYAGPANNVSDYRIYLTHLGG